MTKKKDPASKRVRIHPRMQEFVDGKLSVEDLDDEEIMRGQFRSVDGDFRGRPTDMIPRKFYNAVVAEQNRRFEKHMQQFVLPAVQTLDEIRKNPRAPADARFKSAVYLLERAKGKVPDKQEMKLEVAKWEENIEALLYEADDSGDE